MMADEPAKSWIRSEAEWLPTHTSPSPFTACADGKATSVEVKLVPALAQSEGRDP